VNRQPLLVALLLLVCWWLIPPAHGLADTELPVSADGRLYDTLLLGIQPGTTQQELTNLLAPWGLTVTRQWPRLNIVEARLADPAAAATAQVAAAQMTSAQAALAAAPALRYADFDGIVTVADTFVPNDPLFDTQWAFAAVGTIAAWDMTLGNPAVVVAVVDTGVDLTHEDIPADAIWTNTTELNGVAGLDDDGNGLVDDVRGWDWSDNDALPQDEHGHGTHVAGVIAAATDNGVGVAGHGRMVKVAPLRVLGANGSGTISNLVAGLDYTVSQGFRIVNLSLTVGFDSPALADAIAEAAETGVLVVTASGNFNGGVLWPAKYPDALAVAATTSDGIKASFSNYGPEIDLAAPGADISSTYLGNEYRSLNGTSMATPHVSALAALLLSLRPDLTRDQLIGTMTATAQDLNAATYPGADVYLGAGEIDFAAALRRASAGLTLSRNRCAAAIAAPNATLPFPIQVDAPTGAPVINAWVNAQLADSERVPVGAAQRGVTDRSGVAEISISTPITPGSYLVRASVGDAVSFVPLHVFSAPITVSLTVPEIRAAVDGEAVPLTVKLNVGAEIMGGVPLPLILSTDLGSFANRDTTACFDITDTVFTGEFFPGTVAGDAHITAWVGSASATATVHIAPGPAARLAGEVVSTTPYYGGDLYVVAFDVSDAYGNAAPDTAVTFGSDQGRVSPVTAVSAGGSVSTTLDLPTFAHGAVTVTATASAALSDTVTIALIEKHFMGAIYLRRGPPTE
jgi:subtilisin family serine protease